MPPTLTPGLFDFSPSPKVIAKENPLISAHRISQRAAPAKPWYVRLFGRFENKATHGDE